MNIFCYFNLINISKAFSNILNYYYQNSTFKKIWNRFLSFHVYRMGVKLVQTTKTIMQNCVFVLFLYLCLYSSSSLVIPEVKIPLSSQNSLSKNEENSRFTYLCLIILKNIWVFKKKTDMFNKSTQILVLNNIL